MSNLRHSFPFDPSYGYDLDALLAIDPPREPPDFAEFWRARYRRALQVDPHPALLPSEYGRPGMRVSDLSYRSTDDFPIRGWLLEPAHGPPGHGFVLGRGYGGIERPDFDLPCSNAVYLGPCFRGPCRSRRAPISENPAWHVLHDIRLPDRCILGGCVDDLWTDVTASGSCSRPDTSTTRDGPGRKQGCWLS